MLGSIPLRMGGIYQRIVIVFFFFNFQKWVVGISVETDGIDQNSYVKGWYWSVFLLPWMVLAKKVFQEWVVLDRIPTGKGRYWSEFLWEWMVLAKILLGIGGTGQNSSGNRWYWPDILCERVVLVSIPTAMARILLTVSCIRYNSYGKMVTLIRIPL